MEKVYEKEILFALKVPKHPTVQCVYVVVQSYDSHEVFSISL